MKRTKVRKILILITLTALLLDVIGVSAEIAEKDACKMEHLLSEETFKKIKTLVKSKQKS